MGSEHWYVIVWCQMSPLCCSNAALICFGLAQWNQEVIMHLLLYIYLNYGIVMLGELMWTHSLQLHKQWKLRPPLITVRQCCTWASQSSLFGYEKWQNRNGTERRKERKKDRKKERKKGMVYSCRKSSKRDDIKILCRQIQTKNSKWCFNVVSVGRMNPQKNEDMLAA